MSKVSSYPSGAFSWVDLTTHDPEKAKEFYTRLFDWEAEDMPTDGGVYSIMRKAGQDVAAIASLPPAVEGPSSIWNSYVNVESADASAARARELGGQVLGAPVDVMTAGRMAVVADPEGAVFMLWQAGEHKGAAVVNEPGTFAWNELYTHNIEQAVAFYTQLFGLKHKTHPLSDGRTYHMFSVEDRDRAGMLEITPDMGPKQPAWLVYFAVANLEETHDKAAELGAKADFSQGTIPTVGTFTELADPAGAHFSMLKVFLEPAPLGEGNHDD